MEHDTSRLPAALIADDVTRALREDVGDGDRTASLVGTDTRLTTRVVARQDAVLAGRPWFDQVFRQLDPATRITWRAADGERVLDGQELCRLDGAARALLTGERTALNFLQFLSATATRAAEYVAAVSGTGARILDTRKTIPGLRLAQKYAARCGGAVNHRLGLFDAILVKENHIRATGSIGAAVLQAREQHPGIAVIVEVESRTQLDEACTAGADRALLDNFDLAELESAAGQYRDRIPLEASGNITLENVRGIAATGVHFISVGDITKSVRAVDLSMRFV